MISVCADICNTGGPAGDIRRRGDVHLHTARQTVSQRSVARVSLRRRSLASHKHRLSLLQGGIHKPGSRA